MLCSLQAIFPQVRSLLVKQLHLSTRVWKPTVAQLVAPFVVCLISFSLELLAEEVMGRSDPHPTPTAIQGLKKCEWVSNCTRILYAPAGVPWVDNLMMDVASKNGLTPHDVEGVALPKCHRPMDCVAKMNATLYTYFLDHPMSTQNAVVFLGAFVAKVNRTSGIPNDVGYWLWFNQTADPLLAMETRLAVDSAILRKQTRNPNATIDIRLASFPKPPWRNANVDFAAGSGGIWYYIPLMIIFFFLLLEIVTEKELEMRVGMQVMGLYSSAYWLSWSIYAVIMVTSSTLLIQISGWLFGFSFFVNSNPVAVFLLFEFYGIAMAATAFLLSRLIPTARAAQTIGFGAVLAGFVFQGILCGDYAILIDILEKPHLSIYEGAMKWALNLYPPYHFAKIYYGITSLSSDTMVDDELLPGVGFYWADLFTSRDRKVPYLNLHIRAPPLFHSYLWMLTNIVLYGFLTWYCDVASVHGALFMSNPNFWARRKPRRHSSHGGGGDDTDVEFERLAVTHASPEMVAEKALLVNHLSKSYKSGWAWAPQTVTALTDMCLRVDRNEIFGLLGHNGAGKTTLVSILTGLLEASSGDAFICGHNILDARHLVQKLTGLCAQHDILWDDLTALEHLELFAVLKGLRPHQAAEEIAQKLSMTGLMDVRHNTVQSYSGGMKRRLSVAISALGNPSVLFMDEPTTGLDPVHRREVWKLIQLLKQHHSIILTTHSMEEADALCDRIGIMARGTLCCLGDTMHLKNKFGMGYSLEVVGSKLGTCVDEVQAKVERLFDSKDLCQLVSREGTNLIFNVSRQAEPELQAVLKMLEEQSANCMQVQPEQPCLIREWRLEHTSLEEVFFRVMALNGFSFNGNSSFGSSPPTSALPTPEPTYGTLADVSDDAEPSQDEEAVLKVAKNMPSAAQSQPYRALFWKNANLQKRQLGSFFCQVFSPVVVVIVLVLLQMVVQEETEGTANDKIYVPTFGVPVDAEGSIPVLNKRGPLTNARRKLLDADAPLSSGGESCLVYIAAADVHADGWVGRLTHDGQRAGFLRHMPQTRCKLTDPRFGSTATVQVPHFQFASGSYSELEDAVFHNIASLKNEQWSQIVQPPLLHLLPDALIDFNAVRADHGRLQYSFAVNDNVYILYHRANNFTRVSAELVDLTVHNTALVKSDVLTPELGRMKLMTWVNQAFIREAAGLPLYTDVGRLMASNFIQPFPDYVFVDTPSIVEWVGTFLYPLALTVQLPIYMYLIVLEKEDGFYYLMNSMGLPVHAYLVSMYGFFAAMYTVVCTVFWASGFLAQLRLFTQTNGWVLLAFAVGWGNALISLSFLLAALVKSKRTAIVLGYSTALVGTMCGVVLGTIVYGHNPITGSQTMPLLLLLNPQWAWSRAVYLFNYACLRSTGCYTTFAALPPEAVRICAALYVDAALCFAAAMALSQPFRTPEAPAPLVKGEESDVDYSQMPPSCVEERRRVFNKAYAADSPLVIRDLSKQYENGKQALLGLNLVVEKGECLGYLGPNGSGKTTTMGLLSGALQPSHGTALIGGKDIQKDSQAARLLSGVCPQFSVLWDELTVTEHMLFYARLKGVHIAEEWDHVQSLLRCVGLRRYQNRLASQLSGGMQRRLSVAISLCGDPSIVILDEPTTGLDPLSRKELWKMLLRARKGRAILLTTHAMEEAQMLCTRIAVLLGGKLQCVGTQQQLLDQLGIGYQLTVRYEVHLAAQVLQYIMEAAPTAEVAYQWRHVTTFWLPVSTRPSQTFKLMNECPPEGLLNWSVSHVGLDELFASIVDGHEAIEGPMV